MTIIQRKWMNFILILVIVIFMGLLYTEKEPFLPEIGNAPILFEPDWYYADEGFERVQFPMRYDSEEKDRIVIVNKLPNIKYGQILILWLQQGLEEVIIDGEIYYQHELPKPFGRETLLGTNSVYVPLDSWYSGKTIELHFSNRTGEIALSHLYIANIGQFIAYVIQQNAGSLILSFFLALGAAASLILYLTIRFKQKGRNGFGSGILIALNEFFFLLVLWIISDCQLLQILTGRALLGSVISYVTFMLMPMPFLSVINQLLIKSNRLLNGFEILYGVNFIVQLLLFVAGVFDYPQMLIVTHLLMGVSMPTAMVVIAKDYKSCASRLNRTLLIGLLIFVALALVAVTVFWTNKDISYLMLVNLAIAIAGTTTMIACVGQIYSYAVEHACMAEMRRHAYEDFLTELGNRHAYEKKLDGYRESGYTANLTLIEMDVNRLKYVNDTMGHKAGDELLTGAAGVLRATFNGENELFRVGGDEFAVIIETSQPQLQNKLEKLQREIDAWKGERIDRLSVAYGYVRWDEHPEMTVEELIRLADQLMYEDKKDYYLKTGFTRRGMTPDE
ncbi:MAG: GGDEF domain-containing protein [bacterium]|nr:GGDEF domain-containing protein [bacterium]